MGTPAIKINRPRRHNSSSVSAPNPHLAFGGNGARYCIGASLARIEIRLMLNAIADIMPNLQ